MEATRDVMGRCGIVLQRGEEVLRDLKFVRELKTDGE